MAAVAYVFETRGDLFRYAGLLNRYAVDGFRTGHGFFQVHDDDELRPGEKVFQHLDETIYVGLIQGIVDFVEHAERARPAAKDGQKQIR